MSRTPFHLADALRSTALVLATLVVALALPGCGGGGDADTPHDVPPPGINCNERPELCA